MKKTQKPKHKLNRKQDTQTLLHRGFSVQREGAAPVLQGFYDMLEDGEFEALHDRLYTLKEWIIVPFSDWHNDFSGIGKHVMELIKAGKKLPPAFDLFFDLIKNIPSESQQAAVAKYEYWAQAGYYDCLVRDHTKYRERLNELLMSSEFHRHLKWLDDIFDLKSRQNSKGIIRRSLTLERGIRPEDFTANPQGKDFLFRICFDSFSWLYDLYGLENGLPLLMKVTVNLTPHGMMIYLPKWMSFDLKRDLILQALADLQKSRITGGRQGPKVSPAKRERDHKSIKTYVADQQADAADLFGKERRRHLIKHAGLPEWTADRQLRKLRSRGEELMTGKSTKKGKTASPLKKTEDPHMIVKLAKAQATVVELDAEAEEKMFQWMSERREARG